MSPRQSLLSDIAHFEGHSLRLRTLARTHSALRQEATAAANALDALCAELRKVAGLKPGEVIA